MDYQETETEETLQGDESQLNDEQASFLKSLQSDEEEQDAEITIQDKAQEEAQAAQEMQALEAVLPFAAKGVSFLDGILKARDMRLGLTESEAESLTGAAAQVAVKYGVESPEWLKQYGAELSLLGTAAIIGFSKFAMMKQIKREEIQALREERQRQQETEAAA